MDKKHKKIFILGICIAVFVGIAVANVSGGFISSLLAGFVAILTPLIACAFVVFLGKHIMAFLESKVLCKIFKNPNSKGMRAVSLILSMLFLLGVIFAVCYMFIPRTISVVSELVNNKEHYIYVLKNEVSNLLSGIFGSSAEDMVANISDTMYAWIEDTFNSFLPKLANIGATIISVIGQVFLGIVVGVLYLFDRENVNAYVGRMANVRMKPENIDKTKYFLAKSDRILIDFVVAKVIEGLVITVCLGIVMTLIGVEASFELAFIVGVLNFIPYVGYIIALLPIALITLVYGSVTQLIEALIFVTIVYTIITSFVTPFIVGSKIKCNMIVMFISMIVGGCLFGMAGMMFGVPAGAVISEFIKEDVERREGQMQGCEEQDMHNTIGSNCNDAILLDNIDEQKPKKSRKKKQEAQACNNVSRLRRTARLKERLGTETPKSPSPSW